MKSDSNYSQYYKIRSTIFTKLLVNFSYVSRRETTDSREGFLLEAGIGRNVHAESMVNQSGIDLSNSGDPPK